MRKPQSLIYINGNETSKEVCRNFGDISEKFWGGLNFEEILRNSELLLEWL